MSTLLEVVIFFEELAAVEVDARDLNMKKKTNYFKIIKEIRNVFVSGFVVQRTLRRRSIR